MSNVYKNENRGKLLAVAAVFAMIVCALAVMMPATDAAPAKDTTYIHGAITDEQTFEDGTNVVIDGDLVIPENTGLTIGGTFTVNDGVTLTVQAGGYLIFNSTAKVEVNGNLVATGANINGSEKKVPSIINNVTTDDDSAYFHVSGSVSVERGAVFAQGKKDTEVTAGSDDTAIGKVVLSDGASFSVSKRSNDISLIANQNIVMNEGTTFNLNGQVANVYVYSSGDASYRTEAAISLNAKEPGDYKDRTTSSLTVTVTSQTTSASCLNEGGVVQKGDKYTVRQYALNLEGQVAAGDKLATFAGKSVNPLGECEYYQPIPGANASAVLIRPIVSVTGNLTIASDSELDIATKTCLDVSGTLNLAYTNGTTPAAATVKINGSMNVTGSVIGTIISSGEGINLSAEQGGTDFVMVNGGSIQLTDASSEGISGFVGKLHLWGSVYTVTSTTAQTNDVVYVMDFADAVAAATEAEVDEVYVYAFGAQNRTTADFAAANGAYVVDTEITIPDFMTVYIQNALVISENGSLVLQDGAVVDINDGTGRNSPAKLWNEGRVIDYSGAMYEYEGTDQSTAAGSNGIFMYEVKKTTDTDTEYYVIYTTLKIALDESNPGEVITLNNKVTITEDLTIPDQVTVETDNGISGVALEINGATLTVNGVLRFFPGQTATVVDNGETNREGAIVLNNMIAGATNTTFGSYEVPGAYFNAVLGDDEKANDYITTLAVAAENSASVETDIKIRGTVTAGDLTFTSGKDDGNLKVVIMNNARVTTGTVTLVNTDFGFDSASGYAEYTGTVTTDATAGTVTMTFQKSCGFLFQIVPEDNGETVTTTVSVAPSGMMAKTSNSIDKITGTVSITEGTVTIDTAVSVKDWTVAQGATLALGKNAQLYVASEVNEKTMENFEKFPYDIHAIAENGKGLTVNGTMTVDAGAKVLWGPVVVNGTMTVADGNKSNIDLDILDVHGTLTVSGESVIKVDLLIADGTVSGGVDINMMIAYPGSDIADAMIDVVNGESTADSTAYYINGELYATVVVDSTIDMPVQILVMFSDVDGVIADSARLYSDEAMKDLVYQFPETATEMKSELTALYNTFMNKVFGYSGSTAMTDADFTSSYDSIYASMDPSTVKGTISSGTGLDLYIDNIKVTGFETGLTVGTHTVSFNVLTGYDGSAATIMFNGQEISNGGTITITPDMDPFTLVATGAVPASTVVVDNGGDSGMGLTDYLLIVLVVLIVIMAIIVAMRLMRS